MLKQRLLTAAVLIPAMIGMIFLLSSESFSIALAAVILVAAWEWARISGINAVLGQAVYLAISAVCAYLLLPLLTNQSDYLLLMYAVVGWWLFNIFQIFQFSGDRLDFSGVHYFTATAGIIAIPTTWLSVVYIHQSFGPVILLTCMVLIWVADSGAYFSGRRWGKTKLAPRVSPGKSWQGVAGGLLLVAVVALFAGFGLYDSFSQQLGFVALSVIAVVMSIFGDLYESLLKRSFGIKDSSQILPGHGGVLDRIDSLTSAMPVFSIGLIMLGQA
jgi:phosphatidate cytidylyltransferase